MRTQPPKLKGTGLGRYVPSPRSAFGAFAWSLWALPPVANAHNFTERDVRSACVEIRSITAEGSPGATGSIEVVTTPLLPSEPPTPGFLVGYEVKLFGKNAFCEGRGGAMLSIQRDMGQGHAQGNGTSGSGTEITKRRLCLPPKPDEDGYHITSICFRVTPEPPENCKEGAKVTFYKMAEEGQTKLGVPGLYCLDQRQAGK